MVSGAVGATIECQNTYADVLGSCSAQTSEPRTHQVRSCAALHPIEFQFHLLRKYALIFHTAAACCAAEVGQTQKRGEQFRYLNGVDIAAGAGMQSEAVVQVLIRSFGNKCFWVGKCDGVEH